MMWAVGARYGYDTRRMRLQWLRFYLRGHDYMAAEEARAQAAALNTAAGGGK